MDADSLNAIGTAVIALTISIGVLSTFVYYLANIQGMHLSVLILTSSCYIITVMLSVKYFKRGVKNV